MKKTAATTLAVLFSITALLSGAFGFSDCAAKCAYEMAKAHQHASMRSARLAAANCCTGVMKNSCEMGGSFEIKIPECSMTCHHTGSPHPVGAVFLPRDTESHHFGPNSLNASITAEIQPKLPLYLKNLSLLC